MELAFPTVQTTTSVNTATATPQAPTAQEPAPFITPHPPLTHQARSQTSSDLTVSASPTFAFTS